MSPLIKFYIGSHPDSWGRLLADILEQDDYWLEVTHDYIQWLFPNKERSRVTPEAPIITSEVQVAFERDEKLQQHLQASFYRMLSFYGLAPSEQAIVKANNWENRKSNWFIEDTHNNLRITRILKCLSVLGLHDEAIQFHAALSNLVASESDCGINILTQQYWQTALKNI